MADISIRDLELLMQQMQQQGWSELRLKTGGINVLLSKDAHTPPLFGQSHAHVAAPLAPPPLVAAPTGSAPMPAADTTPATAQWAASIGAIDTKWTVVTAPNLGTFYRSPKPGSPAFVEVGQRVEAGAEMCLIEVMKLFTSVRAEVRGTVRHIAVADTELVEGGQPLIYIET